MTATTTGGVPASHAGEASEAARDPRVSGKVVVSQWRDAGDDVEEDEAR